MPLNTSLQYLAFCEAANQGNLNAVKAFLKEIDINNCYVEYNKNHKVTPLLAAVNGKQREVVEYLLDNGADPNSSIPSTTPLVAAITSGQEDMVELLLNHGADINLGNPLKAAIKKGDPLIVKKILAKNPTLSANEREESPLYLAVTGGNDEIVEALLEKDKNSVNKLNVSRTIVRIHERTLLYLAASLGHTRVVQKLLHAGAELGTVSVDYSSLDRANEIAFARKTQGRTALWIAAINGHIDTMNILLEQRGSLKHARDILCQPARKGALPIIKALIEAAIKAGDNNKTLDKMIKAKNYNNEGPVDLAYQNGHFDVVYLLLKHGAFPSAKTLKMAQKAGDKSMLNALYEGALAEYVFQISKNDAPRYKKQITLFGKSMGFGYSREEKKAAAEALQKAISECKREPEDQEVIDKINHDLLPHLGALQNRSLGKIFKHLSLADILSKHEISEAAVIQWAEFMGYKVGEDTTSSADNRWR